MITKYRCAVPRIASLFLLLSTLVPSGGCVQMAAAWANMTGGDWIDAEFKLTREPLLVLVDDRNGLVNEPRAMREVYKTIAENFAHFKVNELVVPYEELQRLQQSDPKYNTYAVRQIGEKLGASQVLYIDVEKFTLQSEGGAPVYKGEFAARIKVLSTDRKHDIRLWPSDESGRRQSVTTPSTPMDGDKSAADIASELGIKLGQEIAKNFYGRREFKS